VEVGVEAVGETPAAAGSRPQTPQKTSVQLPAVNYDSTFKKKIVRRKA
jgi:hypothetical protein